MIKRLLAAASVVTFLGPAAAIADEALKSTLEALYQKNIALVGEDKIDEALVMRTDEVQAEVKADLAKGTAEEQANMRQMLKGMTPDTFSAEHVEKDGDAAAVLYGMASKVLPFGPEKGQTKRVEMMVEFARAGDEWRIGMSRFLGDPDAVQRIDDESFDSEEMFDDTKTVNLGGRIVRVALEADHTRIIIRMLDEEQAIYLPDQGYLKERGFNVELLQPYKTVEAGGYPHKTHEQKMWATSLQVN